jgi:hypothetical protein
MIREHEIRIGNWVKGIATGLNIKVDLHFFNEAYDDDTMLDWYNGIPLTPELLVEKCGFKYWDNDWYYMKTNWMELSVNVETGEICIQNNAQIFSKKHLVCKYIHQLQNLVYSLTQTELPIQL